MAGIRSRIQIPNDGIFVVGLVVLASNILTRSAASVALVDVAEIEHA